MRSTAPERSIIEYRLPWLPLISGIVLILVGVCRGAEPASDDSRRAATLPYVDESLFVAFNDQSNSGPHEGSGRVDEILRDHPLREASINSAPPVIDESGAVLELPEQVEPRVSDNSIPGSEGPGPARHWSLANYQWQATGQCYRPLYFEEISAERHGLGFGCLQPVISAGHFFGTVPLLPYKMAVDSPHKPLSALGHFRPGTCAPWYHHPSPVRLDATLIQGGLITALVFLP